MDPIKIIKDFQHYLNIEVSKIFNYNESYTASIDSNDKKMTIIIESDTGTSTISRVWINEIDENKDLITDFNNRITEYLSKIIPNFIKSSIRFEYEPKDIIISFNVYK